MGVNSESWVHRLSEVDQENKIANCAKCGPTEIYLQNRLNKSGKRAARCAKASRESALKGTSKKIPGYTKKTICAKCSFRGDPCQFDIDHIDGDPMNNDLSNIRTLCSNCHRLKTKTERKMFFERRAQYKLAVAEAAKAAKKDKN